MGKPTLLVPGKLRGKAGAENPGTVPINYIIEWIRKRMPEFGGAPPRVPADRVLIVKSETGSGKSTVLPAYIFRLLRSEKTESRIRLGRGGVICTQPRILTAQTLARDMSADGKNYPDLVLGETVGYQTGAVNEKPARGLIYATSGVLLFQLRLLADADLIEKYRFIVVDEAHERSLNLDSLLLHLKKFIARNLGNPRLPFVLLASATLPEVKYAKYFGVSARNIVKVEGRAYGVTDYYPQAGTNNYPLDSARLALRLHEGGAGDTPDRADVLVFMPGKREIDAAALVLEKANERFRREGSETAPFLLLKVTREEVVTQDPSYALLKADPDRLWVPPLKPGGPRLKPSRRIVLATVVAETGVTIETLKYVVDNGWNRTEEVYYPGGYRGVVTRPAAKSRVVQRKGRAGRLFPGEFYPTYTRNVYEALEGEQMPDIVTGGVAPIYLDVVRESLDAEGVFRLENVDLLDPPPTDALIAAHEAAVVFGYIRHERGRGDVLTRLGVLAGRTTHLEMSQVQTILAGFVWKVSIRDLATIVALYGEAVPPLYRSSSRDPAVAEKSKRAALAAGLPDYLRVAPAGSGGVGPYLRARLLIMDDFIEALIAFGGFVRALDRTQGDLSALHEWCDLNEVDFEGASLLAALREEVVVELIAAGLNPFWGGEYRIAAAPPEEFVSVVRRLKRCIYAGLRFTTLTRGARDEYVTRAGDPAKVAPFLTAGDVEQVRSAGGRKPEMPRRLVTNTIRLKKVRTTDRSRPPPLLYQLAPSLVSVLDGYVGEDVAADRPRGILLQKE